MREETEFSTSNFDSKSHAGTELTNVSDENTTSMADEVSAIIFLKWNICLTENLNLNLFPFKKFCLS